jgi:hypothetical protein
MEEAHDEPKWRKPFSTSYKTYNDTNVDKIYKEYTLFSNEWPSTTPICCWNDGEKFDTIPVPLPRGQLDDGRIQVCGVFCSVSCAKRYSIDYMGYRVGFQSMMMSTVCEQLFGDASLGCVAAAPPRNTLTRYGGHLSITAYRSGILNHTNVTLCSPPLVQYPIIVGMPAEGNVVDLRRPNDSRIQEQKEATTRRSETLTKTPGMLNEYVPEQRTGGLTRYMRPRGKKND